MSDTVRLYYDPVTGKALHTYKGPADAAPSGDWIDFPESKLDYLHTITVVNGQPTIGDVNALRDLGVQRINELTDEARSRLMPKIAGQETVYREKYEEAKTFLAQTPYPTDLTDYPFIAAEVGVNGATALDVAQLFWSKGQAFKSKMSQLENYRTTANNLIRQKTTRAEMRTVANQFKTLIAGLF